MSPLLIIIIIVLIAIACFVAYRMLHFHQAGRETLQRRFKRIQPLFDKLEDEQTVTQEEIRYFAESIQTREATFHLLRDHGMAQLFPADLYTTEKAGESYLSNWLEFPNELDASPDEIKHMKKVSFEWDGQPNRVYYQVYKYRINEPHWAAKKGWMLGVAGPYFETSEPYDRPQSTFSRGNAADGDISPDEEAQWVHENITRKNL